MNTTPKFDREAVLDQRRELCSAYVVGGMDLATYERQDDLLIDLLLQDDDANGRSHEQAAAEDEERTPFIRAADTTGRAIRTNNNRKART